MKKIISSIICISIIITTFLSYPTLNVNAEDVDSNALDATVMYTTHVQSVGWQDYVSNGEMSGTEGKALRLEGIKIKVDSELEGDILYSTHCQTYGWLDWVSDDSLSGTVGEAKRLEAIEIKLTGELAKYYDVCYRVHCQTYGWLDWVKNGQLSGTEGKSKRLEGIEIKLVKKQEVSEIDNTNSLEYTTHCQTYGWLDWVEDGKASGTSGEAKRLEGIKIKLNSNLPGGITYRTHVQTYGWGQWTSNGSVSGTTGEAKRLEAIQIRLNGEIADNYDVYYRVHIQSYGWLGWAKNGDSAGSSGLSKRLEAIEIMLVEKDTEPELEGQEYLSYITSKSNGILVEDNKEDEYVDSSQYTSEQLLNIQKLNPMKTNKAHVDNRVSEIINQYTNSQMTTYEKTVALYKYIQDNYSYSWYGQWKYSEEYVVPSDGRLIGFSESVLFDGYGSCLNYSSAFVVLTRALGLESYVVYGSTAGAGGAYVEHYWVNIKINGELYTFDPQVDAQTKSYNLFLKTDNEVSGKYSYSDRNGDIAKFGNFVLK